MATSLDAAIRDQFVIIDRSVDDLLCHPDDAQQFAGDINKILGDDLPAPEILSRLIALRKLGQDKGGFTPEET